MQSHQPILSIPAEQFWMSQHIYNFVLLMLNTYQYNCLLDAMWKEQEGVERRNEGKKIGKKEKTRNLTGPKHLLPSF